jgi:hypothetical protein
MTRNKEKKEGKGRDDKGNEGDKVWVAGAMNKAKGRRVLWTTSRDGDGRRCTALMPLVFRLRPTARTILTMWWRR